MPILAEKRRLYGEIPGKVFVAEDGTEAAQQEVLDLIADHLQAPFPDRLTSSAPRLTIAGSQPLRLPPRCWSRKT